MKIFRIEISNNTLFFLFTADLLISLVTIARILDFSDVITWLSLPCKLYVGARFIPIAGEVNTLMVITVERYLAFLHPEYFQATKKTKNVLICIVLLWILCFIEGIYTMYKATVRTGFSNSDYATQINNFTISKKDKTSFKFCKISAFN